MNVRRLGVGAESELLHATHLFDEPPDATAVRAYLADERSIFLLAYEGSEAIGFLRGTELLQLRSPRKQMFLYEVSVKESFRRRGVGTALVRSLLKDCRDLGFEEVFVLTDPANEAAVSLFRSTGAVTETPADRMFVYSLQSHDKPGA